MTKHGDNAPNWVRARARASLLDAFNEMCEIAKRDVDVANRHVANRFDFNDYRADYQGSRPADADGSNVVVAKKSRFIPGKDDMIVRFLFVFEDEENQRIVVSKLIGGKSSNEQDLFALRPAWISEELKMELMPESHPDTTLAPWQAVERALYPVFFPDRKDRPEV